MLVTEAMMKAKHTWMTCVLALSGAALGACGGRAPAPSYPDSGTSGTAPSAAEAPTPMGEPAYGGAPESADRAGPAPAAKAPRAAGQSAGAREAPARSDDDPFAMGRKDPNDRPGLATQWGERRSSEVTSAPFVRADRLSPFAVTKLFYNDPQGIAAMSDTLGGSRQSTRRFAVGAGYLEVGLRDGSGRFLTGFRANGDNFVTGLAGHRYSIAIKNHSPGRIEAVVSVDGLDVIDGQPASLQKRGYLLDPYGDLEIDGFRTSTSEVAAFRFGSVRNSYAARKHGNTRNVGVIGVAVFHERGDSPRRWGSPRTNADVRQRTGADPFPNRYATPPN